MRSNRGAHVLTLAEAFIAAGILGTAALNDAKEAAQEAVGEALPTPTPSASGNTTPTQHAGATPQRQGMQAGATGSQRVGLQRVRRAQGFHSSQAIPGREG